VKKWIVLALSLLISKPVIAEDAVPPAAEAAVAPAAPAEPRSVGVTGETASAPQPVGMTERQGEAVFITLTRTAFQQNDLPFNAQSAIPENAAAYDAQNAGDIVGRLTSVSIAPQGALGTTRLAGIRGATSNQTLVLIDGRPMGGVGLSASQDMAEIPTEQIDHIEIVRGGVSALYGPNAIGGVINVITKRATHSGLPVSNIGMEFGSYGRQGYRLNFGSRTGPVDYFFSGNQQTESGFRDNSDARTHNIGGNVGLSMGGAGKLLLDISSYHANAGVPGQLFPPIPPSDFDNSVEKVASTPDARQTTDSGYVRTSYLLPLPMDSLATLRAFGSKRRVQFEIPTFFVDTDRHEQSNGGEAQLNLPLGLMVGGAFNHDRLDSRDIVTVSNNYIASVENWGVFAQEDFRWKMLAVIPSVRFDQHSTAGDATNPRVQVITDATDWLRFSGSAGKSFRAPTIDDLYTPFTDFGFGMSYQGNPDLRPEKAWTYDAGFQVGKDSATLKAGYFRANITDLIQTTPDLAATSINVGQARRQGAEIELAHILNAYFRDSLNYTYLDNRGKPQGFTDWVNLRLSPRHTVNYLATLMPIKGLKLDNTLRYLSSRYEGNNNTSTKLGDYLIWGVRVAYQIRQLEMFVGVEDLNNKRYEERGGYPLPGRTAYGGLTLRLWG
jgi:vitamin B12 transporter